MIPLKPSCLFVDGNNTPLNFGPLTPGLLIRGVWMHLYQGGIGANYASFSMALTKIRVTTTAQMKEGDVLVGPDPTVNTTTPRVGTALLADGGGVTVYIPLNVIVPPERSWLAIHVSSGDAVNGYAAVDADFTGPPPVVET